MTTASTEKKWPAGWRINPSPPRIAEHIVAAFREMPVAAIGDAVRDLAEWAQEGMPIFARGHTHRGPSKDGPGEINVPIACAGLAVLPGDLIVGDADGVIAIPAADVADILERTRAHLVKEALIRESNRLRNSDPERFDAVLRAKGLPI